MAVKHVTWKFPYKDFFFLKIETLTVAILALMTFIFSFYGNNESWFIATVFTIVFVGLYYAVSYGIQKFRQIEENYKITDKHFEVHRRSRKNVKKEKVLLKDITLHKLDKFFLGGYLLTKKRKKHLLFFNTKEELEKFEKHLLKHLKKK